MRKSVLPLLFAVLVAGPLAAQMLPDDPATYPLTSFLDWTENPQCDALGPYIGHTLTDASQPCGGQDVGQYNFFEGMLGVLGRALERYPQEYGPGSDTLHELQVLYDSLLHNRPRPPYDHYGDVGHPAYMPDWNHNGVFGDAGTFGPDGSWVDGDFDRDTDGNPHSGSDAALDTGYFLYPIAGQDGSVQYEPGKHGVAHELKIVNSRGLVLDATLWIPGEAFAGGTCSALDDATKSNPEIWEICLTELTARGLPGVVFNNGLSSRQEHYYYLAMRLAAEGYVVLTYDPAGQGESEGAWEDLFGYSDPRPPDCEFVGACHDSQDMTRWFVGQTLSSVSDPGFRFEARKDPAANPANPLLAALDPSSIAIAGNSMGALSTLSYLDYLGDSASPGNGVGDSQLPVVKAAISLSGAAPTKAFVPLQFQTSDYDGSPALIGPTVFGIDLGNPDPSSPGEGIGYHLIKSRYNALRNGTSINEKAALSLIVLEGGVHTDHVAVPYVTRTLWSNSLASDYAADWLNCHVKGDSGACGDAIFARPHLSRAFASEQVPTGNRGTTASVCIQKPDRASLNQDPQAFVSAYTGTPVYDCQ